MCSSACPTASHHVSCHAHSPDIPTVLANMPSTFPSLTSLPFCPEVVLSGVCPASEVSIRPSVCQTITLVRQLTRLPVQRTDHQLISPHAHRQADPSMRISARPFFYPYVKSGLLTYSTPSHPSLTLQLARILISSPTHPISRSSRQPTNQHLHLFDFFVTRTDQLEDQY